MSRKKMILKLLTVIVGTVIAAFGLDIAIYAGALSHKVQKPEYNGKQKTLELLRFQGFEHSEKDQRLLN